MSFHFTIRSNFSPATVLTVICVGSASSPWFARATASFAVDGTGVPKAAKEAVALANQGLLAEPTQITVKTVAGEKFERIVKWQLKDRPVMREPGDDSDEIGEYHSNSPGDLGVSQEPDWDDEVPF